MHCSTPLPDMMASVALLAAAVGVGAAGVRSAAAADETPSDASVDEMLPGDLETAKQFGERVADIAAKLNG